MVIASPLNARQKLSIYLTFYNQEWPHQSPGYRTPADVYHQPGSAYEDTTFPP